MKQILLMILLFFTAGMTFAYGQTDPNVSQDGKVFDDIQEKADDAIARIRKEKARLLELKRKIDDETDASTVEEGATDPTEAETELPPSQSSFMKVIEGIFHSGPIGMIRRGGWFMPPILLLGIITAGVIIERYRSLKMLGTDSSEIREKVQGLLIKGQIEEALRLCDNEQGSVPAILTCGLRKFYVLSHLKYDPGKIDEQVVKSMDDYGVHIVAELERHLPILATISSVAPMLGFLGTVSGMINSFNDIVAKMGEINIVSAAADGISEALLTTCFGLIVGIPAFIAYNYFTSVINSFVLEVEESSTELIESVTMQMALNQEKAQ